MEYLPIIVLILLSYLIGRIFAPTLIYLLKTLSGKTKNTLDDYILKEIEGPLESVFFIFVMYLFPKYLDFFKFSNDLVEQYLVAAIFLSLTFFAVKIIKAFFNWYYDEGHEKGIMKIDLTLLPFLQKFFQVVAALVGIMLVLNELGFNITGIIAITSLAGIILGLASQETLANLFAGLALQLDRPFKYGDLIRLPSGEIVKLRKIGIRSTKLYDPYGNTIILSNSEFAKQRVNVLGNEKEGFKLFLLFDAPLSLEQNELEVHMQKKLEKMGFLSNSKNQHPKIHVLRIKAPGWYEGLLELSISQLGQISELTTNANNILIEKINSKQNNRKK